MNTEIVLKDLDKYYGKKQALRRVNLTISQGMFGLLGPNGAGKTTLMKILATLLPKTGGKVTICGTDISQEREIRRMVGYLPQDFGYYPGLSWCFIRDEKSRAERTDSHVVGKSKSYGESWDEGEGNVGRNAKETGDRAGDLT